MRSVSVYKRKEAELSVLTMETLDIFKSNDNYWMVIEETDIDGDIVAICIKGDRCGERIHFIGDTRVTPYFESELIIKD